MRSLQRFVRDDDYPLSSVDSPLLMEWVAVNLEKSTRDTVIRYIESLKTIFTLATDLGVSVDTSIFDEARRYVSELTDESFRFSTSRIDDIRRLAQRRLFGIAPLDAAVDAYLYSFYNGGVNIAEVIPLKFTDPQTCEMPQTDIIRDYHRKPVRKYIFPLQQGKMTPRKIEESLVRNFRYALRYRNIELGSATPADFIVEAWISVARLVGISLAEICACSPAAAERMSLPAAATVQVSAERRSEILRTVANAVVDMSRHWYAIRFVGDERLVRERVAQSSLGDYYKLYYPMEKVCRKVGRKKKLDSRPTIRNVMFLETTPSTVQHIAEGRVELGNYYVITNHYDGSGGYAIIPNAEMRMFSALVSNGQDIIGEEELQEQMEIISGHYVQLNEGLFKGYSGRVIKVRRKQSDDESTILELELDRLGPAMTDILDKKIYVSVSQALVDKIE
jgi:transcription antitermination factor NusG